jgi:NAD(P)-dependent dehydrogenase (short-subunit alcohol dehydrogenase family)
VDSTSTAEGKRRIPRMSLPTLSLAGEVALVTGGRQGIGRTIARAFAEAGADVAVCDLVTEDGALQGAADEIEGLGRRCLAIRADTSRKADVESMTQRVMDHFGRIDILFNNAGVLIRSSLLDMSEETWDTLINVDLKGYFLCAQAVGKRMVARGRGKIVSVATQFAFKTAPGMAGYSIAKAGVVMLTRALATELGRYGVRANAIAPGLIRTDFSRASWSDPAFLKQYEASAPLGRIGEPTDLVGAVLFLASDASAYVTGHTIFVEGGALA